MLRGNYTVRMDEKGRIKLPAAYRRYIDEHYGADFYVTSLTGECARLYPMREWLAIEDKLQARGTMDAAVRKFLDRTSFYGQPSEMDTQGRLLIHPLLRTRAELAGEALAIATERLAIFDKRFQAVHANFTEIGRVLAQQKTLSVQGVLADLGVSSLQLDRGDRGFSFAADAPLDMRMDQSQGETAADL